MSLADLAPFFDTIEVSPPGWPQPCVLAAPNRSAIEHWPGYPDAALPLRGRMGSGCGRTLADARIAAMAEAIEIASLCRWGDEDVRSARAVELQDHVLLPNLLNGFLPEQILDRGDWNADMVGTDWIPPEMLVDNPTEWVKVKTADGVESAWAPADFVFLGQREVGDTNAVAIADTNGCAAGTSIGAAQMNAVLELVERDAAGRWWYGQRSRPLLRPTVLSPEGKELSERLCNLGFKCHLFDITTDLGISAVAAIGEVPEVGAIGLGFAARLSQAEAAERALSEMTQMLLKVIGAQMTGRASLGLARWLAEVNISTPPISPRVEAPLADTTSPATLSDLLKRLADCGVRVWFVDQTRPEFKVPVWRAVSPGLCHWKPRFARPRLLCPDLRDLAELSERPNMTLLRI